MPEESEREFGLTSKERQSIFLELAAKDGGATAQEAYERAIERGDDVTVEAFHNLGRRLTHRGLFVAEKRDRSTYYSVASGIDGQWLDEEHLASIVDPDYPLIALTVLRESLRQLRDVPESVWVELRERLKAEPAQDLFRRAIVDYADNLRDEMQNYNIESARPEATKELPTLRQQIENLLRMLIALTKNGLGLSREAINLPVNVEAGLHEVKRNPGKSFYDEGRLVEEIAYRISAENMVVEARRYEEEDREPLVAAVDGSTRGGLLATQGEEGDLALGHAPMVSINTSVAQINRSIKVGNRLYPAFMRLPEKPEDMQQQENRYTVMAKLFYPDLTDSQYAHSLWNAMDVLESRAALRVMRRWYTSKTSVEIAPADVVMRDGTITPNDRDFFHYKEQDSYGRIVRDLIEANWEIAKKCKDDGQTLCGVVKTAELRVFSPVVNWFACQLAARGGNSQLVAWPLRAMNLTTDQALLTRILTVGVEKGSPWHRTCLVLRPFHATTNFAHSCSDIAGETPADKLIQKADAVVRGEESDLTEEDKWFWSNFRGEKDVYVQMLRTVWYAGFFLGSVPRLDIEKTLPRFEFLVVKGIEEAKEAMTAAAQYHLGNLLRSLEKVGFDVSSDHSMFTNKDKVDVLPSLTIKVHETVKIWASELLARVEEYIGYHLTKFLSKGPRRNVRIRKWSRSELEGWLDQMRRERNLQAGVVEGEVSGERSP